VARPKATSSGVASGLMNVKDKDGDAGSIKRPSFKPIVEEYPLKSKRPPLLFSAFLVLHKKGLTNFL
jgi:hypothetical protein